MLQGILKHAKNQRPLVHHAWKITTSRVNNPITYFQDEEVQEDTPTEEPIRYFPDKTSDIRNYTHLGDYWISNLYPVKRVFINPQGLFPEVYSSFVQKHLPQVLREVSKEIGTNITATKFNPYYRDGGAIINLLCQSSEIG